MMSSLQSHNHCWFCLVVQTRNIRSVQLFPDQIVLCSHFQLNWPWPHKTNISLLPHDPSCVYWLLLCLIPRTYRQEILGETTHTHAHTHTHTLTHTHTHTRIDDWKPGQSISIVVMIIQSLCFLAVCNALFYNIWGTACYLSGHQYNERKANIFIKDKSLSQFQF